ncbi:MAG: acetolactate synthase small subunit [Synergistetes bacterium]|nr:acetolactate synthase small subunit [Synergistota bacterium]MCX8127766.1 acetolactate synthase small subunit [Synergistota bacterium]MDW8191318.1 acetolactate synthase small subunit [Synergistota bacterium]
MRHVISIWTEDHPGVLCRIASLIFRRGYNVESLSVGRINGAGISRFTIVFEGDDEAVKQIIAQFRKLVEVIAVEDLTSGNFVERGLSLVKVEANAAKRLEVFQLVDVFRAHVIDVGEEGIVVEVTGDKDKINACISAFKPYGIREIACSGSVAMKRVGFNGG